MSFRKKRQGNILPSTGNATKDMWGRDPSQFMREIAPEFVVGEGNQKAPPEKYIMTMCHVCHLQLFPEREVPGFFPAATHSENTQYVTGGGLSLCERHFKLVNELTKRQITVDKWPSQLIRGIVTYSREQLRFARDSIASAQQGLSTVQTVKTVITPAPIIGNAYSPVTPGVQTGAFTNYFFAFPMQRQVVDQNAVNTAGNLQSSIQLQQQYAAHFSEQLSKYNELLERTRRENPPKFVTDIRCGQSEMPLGTKTCIWCGKSQGYSGDVVPVNVLVEDVDPMGVVPIYADRTGASILSTDVEDTGDDVDDEFDESEEESEANMSENNDDAFCTQCGMKVSDRKSKFCDNCGAAIELKTKPTPASNQGGRSKSVDTSPSGALTGSKKEEEPGDRSASTLSVSNIPPTPKEPIKYCPECGKKLPFEIVKFCPYCGTKIPPMS